MSALIFQGIVNIVTKFKEEFQQPYTVCRKNRENTFVNMPSILR